MCAAVGYGCRGESPGCTIGNFVGAVLMTRDGGRSWQRYESSRTTLTAGKLCGSAGVCPAGVSLHGIACVSASVCRAVGEDGTVLATTDAGKTWAAETTPTDNFLAGIACPGPDTCLAVGGGGTILGTGRAGHSTGLPLSWTSWVVPPAGPTSPRQTIRFSYGNTFSINLPHFPAWKCPWWDPPGTWCMKEPGA
jgi:hypothetical protein